MPASTGTGEQPVFRSRTRFRPDASAQVPVRDAPARDDFPSASTDDRLALASGSSIARAPTSVRVVQCERDRGRSGRSLHGLAVTDRDQRCRWTCRERSPSVGLRELRAVALEVELGHAEHDPRHRPPRVGASVKSVLYGRGGPSSTRRRRLFEHQPVRAAARLVELFEQRRVRARHCRPPAVDHVRLDVRADEPLADSRATRASVVTRARTATMNPAPTTQDTRFHDRRPRAGAGRIPGGVPARAARDRRGRRAPGRQRRVGAACAPALGAPPARPAGTWLGDARSGVPDHPGDEQTSIERTLHRLLAGVKLLGRR